MRIPQSGLRIDSPAWPLLQAYISYWGITSAAGNAFGTTLVCADLLLEPNYAGLTVKILDGPNAGQARPIDSQIGNTITVVTPWTNPAGGVQQIAASIRFVILSAEAGIGTIINNLGLVFDLVNAIFTLKETGGSLLATAAEQTLVEVAGPMGVFKPAKVKVDCTNMAWGDTTILRWYERIAAAGAYIQKDEITLNGPQIPPLRDIDLEPNRHGVRITLQQTAGGMKNYGWEYLYED